MRCSYNGKDKLILKMKAISQFTVCVCAYTMHVETRSLWWVSSSVALHLIFKIGSLHVCQTGVFTGILLPRPLECWD